MATSKWIQKKNWFKEYGTDQSPALGFIELSSIAKGLYLTDRLVKKAPIRMICSQSVSSGKHVLLYFGSVAAVEEAHQEAKENVGDFLLQEVLISSVHEGLVPFLDSLWNQDGFEIEMEDSVAILESKSLAGAILSADAALKSADVQLTRMKLGQGIGGRAYFLICGHLEEVEAAVESARARMDSMESFLNSDLIANPESEALRYF